MVNGHDNYPCNCQKRPALYPFMEIRAISFHVLSNQPPTLAVGRRQHERSQQRRKQCQCQHHGRTRLCRAGHCDCLGLRIHIGPPPYWWSVFHRARPHPHNLVEAYELLHDVHQLGSHRCLGLCLPRTPRVKVRGHPQYLSTGRERDRPSLADCLVADPYIPRALLTHQLAHNTRVLAGTRKVDEHFISFAGSAQNSFRSTTDPRGREETT